MNFAQIWRATAVALTLTLALTGVVTAAVWTDQADYSPGSVVTISGDNSNGAGYVAGETVDVAVSGPNGYSSSCSSTTNDLGGWSCQVTLWNSEDALGMYEYTATGQQSGVVETGEFSDNVGITITNGDPSASLRPWYTASPASVTISGNYVCTAVGTVCNSVTSVVITIRQRDVGSGFTGTLVTSANATLGAGSTWSHTFSLASGITPNGMYDVQARLNWLAGTSAKFTDSNVSDDHFGVDRTLPTSTIDTNTGGTLPAATGSATDSGAALQFSGFSNSDTPKPVHVEIVTNPGGVTVAGSAQDLTLAGLGSTGQSGTWAYTYGGSALTPGGYCLTSLATDHAGNVQNPVTSSCFTIVPPDSTAPTGSISINDGATWTNNASVTVDLAGSDATGVTRYRLAQTQTGLDAASDVAVSPAETSFARTDLAFSLSAGDGAAKEAWLRLCDAANNCADFSDTIGLDTVKPVITANTNGYVPGTWSTTAVQVDFSCNDALSGVASSNVAGDTLSSDGADQQITNTGTCTDNAGNVADSVTVTNIDIDQTDPLVDITVPASGGSTILSSVTVSGTASDATSGVASVTLNGGANVYAAGAFSGSVALACGSNTITATATDVAGNDSTDSITYNRICFDNLRYYQPLDQSSGSTVIINVGKYGRVIPTKVTLSSDGTPVDADFLATYGLTLQIGVNSVSCAGGDGTDSVEAYADAGSSSSNTNLFRWDATAQQWIYNLDTKAPAGVTMTTGQCYRLDVYVSDGTNKVKVSTTTYAVFKPTR